MYISVIIPVYNGEKFIARAIDSVLKQTLPADEIIVINDGSKDGTEKILEQYAGKIMHKTIPNGGVSNARNAGIAMSHGDWLAFLDSDDEWFADKLEQQVKLIVQYSDAGMIFSGYQLSSAEGEKIQDVSFDQIHPLGQIVAQRNQVIVEDCFYLLFVENFIKTSTVMIRRDILSKAGLFDVSLRTVEDRDLFIQVSYFSKVLFLRESLVRKWHSTNSLGQESLQVIADRERVQWANFIRYKNKIKKDGKIKMVESAICATKRSRFASYFHSKDLFGAVIAGVDFFIFKMVHLKTKIFVK